MGPPLEQLTVGLHPAHQVAGVGAKAGEDRQFLRADNHVHRVDLQQADAVEQLADVATVDAAAGTGVGKTLGGEGDAARLRERDGVGRHEAAGVADAVLRSGSTWRADRNR